VTVEDFGALPHVSRETLLDVRLCLCCLRKQPPHFAAAVYLSLFSVHVSRET